MKDTTEIKIRALLDTGDLNGNDIAYLLSLKGYSQGALAKELGLALSTVHEVINNRQRSFNVATRIAAILNTTTERLWPGYYTQPGQPKNIRNSPKRVAA